MLLQRTRLVFATPPHQQPTPPQPPNSAPIKPNQAESSRIKVNQGSQRFFSPRTHPHLAGTRPLPANSAQFHSIPLTSTATGGAKCRNFPFSLGDPRLSFGPFANGFEII